jgi:L-aminopeptidase/D-esterase-like protein
MRNEGADGRMRKKGDVERREESKVACRGINVDQRNKGECGGGTGARSKDDESTMTE